MILAKTIELLLQSLGRSEETEFYLRKFQADDGKYVALIVPDAATLGQMEEVLDFDLEFLLTLGLKPALVLPHDAEPPRSKLVSIDILRIPEGGDLTHLVPEWARRVHFLRMAGPLRNVDGTPLSLLSLRRPPPTGLHPDDHAAAERASHLLRERPGTHVSICTPLDLLAEMFTVKGAGTIVRRGSHILHADDPTAVDIPRLRDLIDHAFGKPLLPAFDLGALAHYYIESDYRGAALLDARPAGLYLSKFAVTTEARGEGLAQELWHTIAAHPSLYWRARASNPIHHWYLRQSDGHHRDGNWTVYWRGIDPAHISALIDECLHHPEDFAQKTCP